MQTRERMRRYAQLTDQRLEQILSDAGVSETLTASMRYSVFAGGKRLRPALCLGACAMLGGDETDALPAACAVELIHTYSLIHDDLPSLDNDDMRRGKPSNHMAFGEANAIIAGDGLQALAFRTLSVIEKPRVFAAVAAGAYDMVVGQSLDLAADGDMARFDAIHRLKTGALIKAGVLAGALCADADEQALSALTAFSEQYGLLFQVTDDILDVEGDAKALGKSVGKDETERKLTSVRRLGLDGAKRCAREAAERACAALEPFGVDAGFFRDLIDITLHRHA